MAARLRPCDNKGGGLISLFPNPAVVPAVALCLATYAAGRRLAAGDQRTGALLAAAALCVPAAAFVLYYLHLVREPAWYVELRSIPWIESLSGGVGLLGGLLEGRLPQFRSVLVGDTPARRLALLLALTPFLKPILLPIGLGGRFADAWEDGVCLQSTMATCGPCSLATVFRALGIPKTEKEIARGAYTGMTGTESWYLLRYARRHGLAAVYRDGVSLGEISAPAILGVKVGGGAGHFIILLGREHGRMTVGDPLSGKILLDEGDFSKLYKFTGTAMEFRLDGVRVSL